MSATRADLQTIQEAGWDMSETKPAGMGLPVPESTKCYWGGRTINSRGEKLGIVHDRQTGVQCDDPELKKQFSQALLQVVLPWMREAQEHVWEDRPYCYERELEGVGLVRGAFRIAGGYGYVAVWVHEGDR